jgi:hypothetical protein
MKVTFERLALFVCAISLSVLAAHAVTAHADAQPAATQTMDELTVRRLRVVDASGAVRLILTGKPLPEAPIDGKIVKNPRGPRQDAGLLFYNDRGDEQGGLVYSGTAGDQGQGLTFDAWRQDQALAIEHEDDASGSESYILGKDMPRTSLYRTVTALEAELAAAKTSAQRAAVEQRASRDGSFGRRRFLLGESHGNSDVDLHDAHGRLRLRLRVTPGGDASIVFLDETGKVTRTIAADGR